MRRALPILLLLTSLLAGCGPALLLLDVRPSLPTSEGPRAGLVARYSDLADQVQATASYYERQVARNHVKMRMMNVLASISVGTAAGMTASAIHPQMPEQGRSIVGTFSISLAATGVVLGLLPHAHQYILKEAGYQRQAEDVRGRYAQVEAACGVAVTADPAVPTDELARCSERMQEALAAARRFPMDSPCKPPTDADLARLLRGAQRAVTP